MKTWIDIETDLEWQIECEEEKMSLAEALRYVHFLGAGWRLPTLKEWESLLKYSKGVPYAKTDKVTLSRFCWAYSAGDTSGSNLSHVRCVRGKL